MVVFTEIADLNETTIAGFSPDSSWPGTVEQHGRCEVERPWMV
ncbi:hypothetical protein [uncultured Pseudoteredinibacter sp.]|nr:hypothetical protein [uncultured Pseudoteredinibacter sp.]